MPYDHGHLKEKPLPRALQGFSFSAATRDGGFFLIMGAMPFKVLDLGGGALELGLVPAIGALTYIVSAPLSGRWSDRVSRTLLCLAGGLVLITAALLAWLAQRLDVLLGLQVLMGLGKALYWPAVEATVGDLCPRDRQTAVLGRFNVAWSGGKTLGFLAGGLLLGCCGFEAVYLAGAASVVAAFLLLPKGDVAADVGASDCDPAETPCDSSRLRLLRNMGWIANTAAYGALGILTHHLPQWFAVHGWSPERYGWYLGLILASQTTVFIMLAGPMGTTGSLRRLWIPQLLSAVAVAAIPVLSGFGGLLATAPIIGLGCGVCYTASIFYSLTSDVARGRNAGIHEGLVGAGGFLPPLVAGVLVRAGLGLSAPYLLAGGLLLAALLLQVGLQVGWSRMTRPPIS